MFVMRDGTNPVFGVSSTWQSWGVMPGRRCAVGRDFFLEV